MGFERNSRENDRERNLELCSMCLHRRTVWLKEGWQIEAKSKEYGVGLMSRHALKNYNFNASTLIFVGSEWIPAACYWLISF